MQCFSSTYNIASASVFYPSRPQKKSAKPSAFYTFENPQVRRSAFYRRPVLGPFRSREQKFQGAKWPGSVMLKDANDANHCHQATCGSEAVARARCTSQCNAYNAHNANGGKPRSSSLNEPLSDDDHRIFSVFYVIVSSVDSTT